MSIASGDPVIQTLLEALAQHPPAHTLVWGRSMLRVAGVVGRAGPVHTLLQRAGDPPSPVGTTTHGVVPPKGDFTRVIMRLPRSKDALRWWVSAAAATLPLGGQLWLAGHQREGIKSALTLLNELVGPALTVRTKRRCRVLVARRGAEPTVDLSLDAASTPISFEAAGRTLAAVTLPGVFSHGRLDEGTRRLLGWLEADPPSGRVLDLGAGAGILGIACAAQALVERVTMVEAAWMGAEACRRTLALNTDLSPVDIAYADVLDADRGPFDLVVTNPPFHDGRHEDRQLITRFAEAAAKRMKPGGRFVAVCNQHLAYRESLEAWFGDVSIAWQDTRFRIWCCRGPRR